MLSTLQRLANTAHVDDSDGFTLIELLIVVVIIGILAAIAIPQFSSTKERAYDSAAQTDLRNVMTSQEVLFAEIETYGSASGGPGGTVGLSDGSTTETVSLSDGVNVSVTGEAAGFTATASHQSSDNTYCVDTSPDASTPGQVWQASGGSCTFN